MTGVDTLRALFDEKKIKIIQEFVQQPQEKFTLQEITKKSKVPLATTHRQLKSLEELNVINKTQVKHLNLYQLSDGSEAQYLAKLLYEKPAPIEEFVNLVRGVENIDSIIMHGKATESRANIVIIGNGINKDPINNAVTAIRDNFNFRISHLILDEEQFIMLERMGQFSGNKTTLLENK